MTTFTDPRDGEVYKTVKIGNQIWLAENLRYRGPTQKFNNWNIEKKNFYYPPNGDRRNIKNYGCLYAWKNARKACPKGWHLPSEEEFETLLTNVGCGDDYFIIASINLRAVSFNNGKDAFDFRALPAGEYYPNRYRFFGSGAYFWSVTEDIYDTNSAYSLNLSQGYNFAYREKANAFSVRCIKD